MALLSTIWIALIALASIADAFQIKSLLYCIVIRQEDGGVFQDTKICPESNPVYARSPFTILSGFAPGTREKGKLRPKWVDEYRISDDSTTLLQFDAAYCLISKKSGSWQQHGCANGCYLSAEYVQNPYYQSGSWANRPDFSNQISGHTGWHFIPQPDNCPNPNTLEDQRADISSVGFLPPAAASTNYAFNTAEGSASDLVSTPAVESLDNLDERVGYVQQPQPKLTTEDPGLALFDSSKWNVKRGVVRKEGAIAIPFQA
ncbi:hypothetical protein MMC31_006672 [Peltigera leucophlebia]|nr:hypothetical protein [Peltigera leucophlebia]